MKIQLINGQFTSAETIDLLSQMMKVKIKFLENKILASLSEEDIKSKESKIINLQKNLSKLIDSIKVTEDKAKVFSEIEIIL